MLTKCYMFRCKRLFLQQRPTVTCFAVNVCSCKYNRCSCTFRNKRYTLLWTFLIILSELCKPFWLWNPVLAISMWLLWCITHTTQAYIAWVYTHYIHVRMLHGILNFLNNPYCFPERVLLSIWLYFDYL